jgi:hypothetical protein
MPDCIGRMSGRLSAASASFWIQRADFVRQYQKVDEFWLPQKDQTLVQVRLYGKKVLTIDHWDYAVNARQTKQERVIVPETETALTSSHQRETTRDVR